MKMPPVSPRVADLGGAALVVVAAAATAFLADAGPVRAWRETRRELAAVRAEEAVGANFAAERASLAGDIEILGRAAGHATEGLPPAMETFAVLGQLARVSRECGVALDRVTPGNLVAGARIATIPVDLSVRGSFFSLVRFLARGESSDHPVRVSRLALTRGGTTADMNLEAVLAVSCLVPGENPGQGAAP